MAALLVSAHAGRSRFLLFGTSMIGGCAVLFGMQVVQPMNEPGTLPYVGAFLLAGAVTGTIYGGLIVICDRWIKA